MTGKSSRLGSGCAFNVVVYDFCFCQQVNSETMLIFIFDIFRDVIIADNAICRF